MKLYSAVVCFYTLLYIYSANDIIWKKTMMPWLLALV